MNKAVMINSQKPLTTSTNLSEEKDFLQKLKRVAWCAHFDLTVLYQQTPVKFYQSVIWMPQPNALIRRHLHWNWPNRWQCPLRKRSRVRMPQSENIMAGHPSIQLKLQQCLQRSKPPNIQMVCANQMEIWKSKELHGFRQFFLTWDGRWKSSWKCVQKWKW